jgi:hypothetical protein
MSQWDTFRITFPSSSFHSLFGIVVPSDFEIDTDCLHELGFSLGFLDTVTDCAIAEIPKRIGSWGFWNRYRVKSAFACYAKSISKPLRGLPFAEFRPRKQRKFTYVCPLGECRGLWSPPKAAN